MSFKLKKSGLNFRVYTNPTTPETGIEEDIVILSEVPMTNWILSPDSPSGAPRTDGDVWIQYSTKDNTKNILKQNVMMIATIKAWQYVDGAWVDREAVSYQNGEWVDWWNGELFKNGNHYNAITGGWSSTGYTVYGPTYEVLQPTFSDVITFNTNDAGQGVVCGSQKKIDLTGYNTICAKCEERSGAAGAYLGIAREDRNVYHQYLVASSTIMEPGVVELDISTLEGAHFVVVNIISNTSNRVNSMTISEIWLE